MQQIQKSKALTIAIPEIVSSKLVKNKNLLGIKRNQAAANAIGHLTEVKMPLNLLRKLQGNNNLTEYFQM